MVLSASKVGALLLLLLLSVRPAVAVQGFVKSFVDASKFGTVTDSPTQPEWTAKLAMMGAAGNSRSAVMMHFDLPQLERRVQVTHASVYCMEHDDPEFLGGAKLAPIQMDWLGDRPKVAPSWAALFGTKGHVGDAVANAFTSRRGAVLAFSDSFRLSSLVESWLNRETENLGLVLYPDDEDGAAGPLDKLWSCRLAASYAPDGRDDCVDTALFTLTTTLSPNASSSAVPATQPPVYVTLRGHNQESLDVRTSTEMRLQGDVAVDGATTQINFAAVLGCELGDFLDAVWLRIESEEALRVDGVTVEHSGRRYRVPASHEGQWLSTAPAEGVFWIEMPLHQEATKLKGAVVSIASAPCATAGAGPLYLTFEGTGTGQGVALSAEVLFSRDFVCGRHGVLVRGLEDDLGELYAVKLRRSASTPAALELSSVAVEYGSVEYVSNFAHDFAVEDSETMPLIERAPCVSPVWVQLTTAPWGCDETGVAVLGTLVGKHGESTERVLLTGANRASSLLARTSFECGLGPLRHVRLRAQDAESIQVAAVTVRYEDVQYEAVLPEDGASVWLSQDLGQGSPNVELVLVAAPTAAKISDDHDQRTIRKSVGIALLMTALMLLVCCAAATVRMLVPEEDDEVEFAACGDRGKTGLDFTFSQPRPLEGSSADSPTTSWLPSIPGPAPKVDPLAYQRLEEALTAAEEQEEPDAEMIQRLKL